MSMELDRGAERTLTELDHARLARLTRNLTGPTRRSDGDLLEEALHTATLVESTTIPGDVVTMHSTVVLRDLETSRRYRLTLCYPDEAEPTAGRVSVLAPLGAGLVGLRVGADARWTRPDGGQGAARLEAILFQPESSGEFTR